MWNSVNRWLLTGTVALSGTAVFAADPATWGPVYTDGPCKGLYRDECAVFQRYKQKEAAEKEAQQLLYQKIAADRAAEQKAKQEAQEKQQAERAAADARRAEESRAYWAKERANKEAEAKAEAVATAALKAKCGADYKKPKIGMPIGRVQECVVPVKMTGQLNRADGVVSTYEGGDAYFHVMEGRVISWGEY